MQNNSIAFKLIEIVRPIRYYFESLLYKKSSNKKSKDALNSLNGKYKGKPLIIVGNGPSLNKTPLHDFKEIPAIGMNKINLLFDKTEWRPSIVISSNPLVIKQNNDFWKSSNIPIFLSWKNHWLLDRFVKRKANFYLQVNNKEFQKDITKGIGAGSTITYAAMQFAYYMGANPVILVGVDHSFAVKDTDKKGAIVKSKSKDESHFDPNYFGTGTWWQLPDLDDSEAAYLRAKEVFEDDNRQILDASIGGKLNVFEKISIDEAKAICKILEAKPAKVNS